MKSQNEVVTATLTVGVNRGRPRVWIEGARLTAAGWTRGTRFMAGTYADQPGLSLYRGPNALRTVSGKDAKPIIDITGKTVEAAGLKGGDRITVEFAANLITITKEA